MRILFMGTPDIAAASLQALLDAGHTIVGVFTRADKPVGRKQILTAPPVKQLAVRYGIPVYQLATLRDGKAEEIFRSLAPDLVVVVAYGGFCRRRFCTLRRSAASTCTSRCCQNTAVPRRSSGPYCTAMPRPALPSCRWMKGATPVISCWWSGVPIGPETTSGELFDEVSAIGAKTLVKAIDELAAGRLTPVKQDETRATKAPPLTKELARFGFDESATHLHNWVRGMNPWPVAYFEYDGKKIKVLTSRIADNTGHAAPGTVLALKPLTVACSEEPCSCCISRRRAANRWKARHGPLADGCAWGDRL